MRFHFYFVIAMMFTLSVQNGQAQRSARTSFPLSSVNADRCASYEAELEMREKYPELGTIEEFEAKFAPLVEATKQRMLSGEFRGAVTQIPVVFHVIHNGEPVGSGNNLNATYINAQLQQLNNDYRKIPGTSGSNSNPDGADTEVEFCMAVETPGGAPLSEAGINRINRNDNGWTAPPYTRSYVDNTIKSATIWNRDNYLNVWVVNLSGGILGWAQFPSNTGLDGLANFQGLANTDGVVVTTSSVGSTTVPNPSGGVFGRGRTLTHESGHWLGLRHIWGDGDGCSEPDALLTCACGVDDYCSDTPNAGRANYGCPDATTCSSVDMKENYMDYTNDACMNIFTFDQKARIQTVLSVSRDGLGLNASTACDLDALVSDFTFLADTDCPALEVQFNNTSMNATSYSWDFGDGTGTSADEDPSYTYAAGGVYTVTLTVGDGVGTDMISQQVAVSGSESFDNLNGADLILYNSDGWGFVAGHNNYTDRAKAERFEASQVAPGSTLTGAGFVFGFASGHPGSTVTFNVWSNDGPSGFPGTILSTKTELIADLNVGGLTVVDFPDIVTTGPIYIGFELDYGANQDTIGVASNTTGETTPTTAYELWDGGGWFSFNGGTGTWGLDISLAITAIVACPVEVTDPPVAEFSANRTTICEDNSVSFTDQSTNNPTSWAWTFGDGGTSDMQNPSYTYTSTGMYTVTLTATNSEGSDVETKTNYITVQAAPTGFSGQASDTEICAGESVNLSMSGTFGGDYSWETSTGTNVSNTATAIVTPGTTTTYTAICDDGVCLIEDDVTITVNALPVVTVTNNGGTLTASSSSTGAIQWYQDDVLISGVSGSTYVATEDGDYYAVLTDSEECVGQSNEVSVVLTAVIDAILDASIVLYPNPVHEKLHLEFNGQFYRDLVLNIVDLSGRNLQAIEVSAPFMEIDMRSYSSGVYLFTFETEDGRKAVRKVIKQD